MTPRIVGVVSSSADLQRALRMRNPPDLFELRLDCLVSCLDELRAVIDRLRAPFIITARDPREGGANDLSIRQRSALLTEFFPHAAALDLELRSAESLQSLLRSARAVAVPTIISFHDFEKALSAARLDKLLADARSLGADIFKVATRTDSALQLERLLDFFERHRRGRAPIVVAMGIGKLGRRSRLSVAELGCALNYAHLGSPKVHGQLSIPELRRALQ